MPGAEDNHTTIPPGTDPKEQVASVNVGGVDIPLARGILTTYNAVGKLPTPDLIQAYNHISSVDRPIGDMRRVLQAHVQLAWYRDVKGEEPPEKVLATYKALIEAPATLPPTGEGDMASGTATRSKRAKTENKKAKTERITAADVIRAGLRRGLTDETILKQVQEKVPTSNADERHVAYYRNKLEKAGELKPKAKGGKKAKKEAAEASEE